MSKFNGMTKVELEMMVDEMNKVLPTLLVIVPTFAQLAKANHEELKKLGYSGNDAIVMAVQLAAKQMGIS
jgi:RNA binding exosome subunit